jgi:GT2 family glycosyltransferase
VTAPLPFCSLVVPTHRRPRILEGCLAALAQLDYPRELCEVIVVDDGGDAPLDAAVRRLGERLPATLLRQPRQGPAAVRNAGAARARGGLLAFTDDDCRPRPGWLGALAREHRRAPHAMLGGHTRNALVANRYAATSQLIIDAGYAWHNGDREAARFLTSNNLALPAAEFRAVGGFDPTFTTAEDRDLCDRWLAAGRAVRYLPEAVVDHAHDLSLRGFCRQHFGYGRGAYRFHAAHRRREGRPVRVEPRFYLGVHRRALRHPDGHARGALQLTLVVWHLANLAGYLAEWRAAAARSTAARVTESRSASASPRGSSG